MEPKALLEYTLDAATYFLKSKDLSATYPNLGGMSAEDVAMDSLVKILESNVRPQTKTYVIEVVRNACFDLMRKKKLDILSVSEGPNEIPDTQLVPLETISTVEDLMLDTLDAEDKQLYTLWITQGLTEDQIAASYAVSPRTIRRRLQELRDIVKLALT